MMYVCRLQRRNPCVCAGNSSDEYFIALYFLHADTFYNGYFNTHLLKKHVKYSW
jgi:hypothetical protein